MHGLLQMHSENIFLATFLVKGHVNCKKDYKYEEAYACIISYILCPGNAGSCAWRNMR